MIYCASFDPETLFNMKDDVHDSCITCYPTSFPVFACSLGKAQGLVSLCTTQRHLEVMVAVVHTCRVLGLKHLSYDLCLFLLLTIIQFKFIQFNTFHLYSHLWLVTRLKMLAAKDIFWFLATRPTFSPPESNPEHYMTCVII